MNAIKELAYPEYRGRHIFTAKFRLVIFLVFWSLYITFLKDWMEETRVVAMIFTGSFVLTTACYYNIFRGRFVIASFIGEILADLVALTAIVYLTGGPQSTYFTVYIFYTILAGMLYNYLIAVMVAAASLACYAVFCLFSYSGTIPPMLVAMDGMVSPSIRSPYFHPLLLALFLLLGVYITKIAHHFTQMRERALEARNRELTALHKMNNTIRSMSSLENVLEEVLEGVLEGLDFEVAFLMYFDKTSRKIKCYPPKNNPIIKKIEEELGFSLSSVSLSADALENAAFRSLKQNQIIFRRDMSDLVAGLEPPVAALAVADVQKMFGLQKMVAVPMVAEGNVSGALFGFTKQSFVGERVVQTLESFANQAAIAVQTAQLIVELKAKNMALQEANRVKSEFLATMSHELRTPLTAIIGFSELLMEGVMGEMNDEQKESVHEVLNNGANLLEMINNLLDLAKVDSGKMELSCTIFDLSELLDRVRRTISSLIQKKHHNLIFDVPPELPPVKADEKRVQQIVLNLLSNAIKFTPDGGTITIFARHFSSPAEANGKIPKLDKAFDKGFFFISVLDTGIGIKEEHLEKIFDIFSQVDSTITRSYEGTGLGLALSKQFVELHNGRLWAESEHGKGAAFSFVLPTG